MIRALLVDDEIRVLEAIKNNIRWKECGIDHLLTAGDVDDAREKYRLYRPDILLTDVEMPDGNGLELIEGIRSEDSRVICLCITCHPEFSYMRKAMQLGSMDYILKPVDYEELESVLMKAVKVIQRSRYGDGTDTAAEDDRKEGPGYYEEDRFLSRAEEYIEQHLLEEIPISVLAEHLGCSTSHVMRCFRKRLDMTVVEYITKKRIDKAKQLLTNTDLPIMTVAEYTGYPDYSYFTRVFRKETGVTPRAYRVGVQPEPQQNK